MQIAVPGLRAGASCHTACFAGSTVTSQEQVQCVEPVIESASPVLSRCCAFHGQRVLARHLLYLIHHQTPSYPTYPHHPPFSLPIDRYSARHLHPRKVRNTFRTQPTHREFSTVLSSSPQALSSGTSIHSPAASHPVNKRILARFAS